MKVFILCLLGFCVLGSNGLPVKDYLPKNYTIDNKERLGQQLQVLHLLRNINEPDPKNVNKLPDKLHDTKSNPYWAKFLLNNHLSKGEIFSVYHQDHLEEAIRLFKSFYHEADFNGFMNISSEARNIANKGLFLYAFMVALVHRPDTFGLILPPIHELQPNYFFIDEVIQKVQQHKQFGKGHERFTIEDDSIERYTNLSPEQLLTYFTEDIGLNSFYFYYHVSYPWWMDGKDFDLMSDHRGEIFYYVMAQLVARYDAERLSNGLEEVSAIDFDAPLDVGFYPSLRYRNGVAFPSRPDGIRLKACTKNSRKGNFSNAHTRLRDLAFRIQNVVDLGRAYSGVEIYEKGVDGLEILSNLLEDNPNSPNLHYYGTLQIYARHLIGCSPEPLNEKKAIPAATQHYETTLRDPASWKFFKWLLGFYDDYFKHLKPYTFKELSYEGVSINAIDVEEFVTYFENYNTDLSDDNNRLIFVKQKRLNHLPLLYNITINSTHDENVLVKVFLGPKYNRYGKILNITEHGHKFYALDYFDFHLKKGVNVIVRNSSEGLAPTDKIGYRDLVDRVTKALHGNGSFGIDGSEGYWAFPHRLLIPKGSSNGMKFQLYAIAIPTYVQGNTSPSDDKMYKRVGTGRHTGNLTLRFPLDRRIERLSFFVPNSFITDVIIRHKD